jgi:hypothetical protein
MADATGWPQARAVADVGGVVGRCPPKDIDEVMICLGEGVVTLDWFLVAIKYEQHA